MFNQIKPKIIIFNFDLVQIYLNLIKLDFFHFTIVSCCNTIWKFERGSKKGQNLSRVN